MKISIITVCLNSETTIEQTIKSVLEQGYENLEYIIIDGKSTDRTMEIVEKYKEQISIIVSEPDKGLYDAMNKGLAMATGDVIGIINSDDWYEPNTFNLVRACFEETDAEVTYGKQYFVYGDAKEGEAKRELSYWVVAPHPTVFVKKEIYDKFGSFDTSYRICADYDFQLRIWLHGVRYRYIDAFLANFRTDGISCRRTDIRTKEKVAVARKYMSFLSDEEKEYWDKYIHNYYKSFFFSIVLKEDSKAIYDRLTDKVKEDSKIAIFGSGKWGKKMCEILSEKNLFPAFFVDNNPSKWHTFECGIEVLEPKVLETFEGVVLVMVRDYSKEILQQINDLNNPHIKCVCWEDFIE